MSKAVKKEKTEFLTLNGIVQWASLSKPRPASLSPERYETDLILKDKSLAKILSAQGVTVKTLVEKDKVTDKSTQVAIADGVPVGLIGSPVIKTYKNTIKRDGSRAAPVALKDANDNTISILQVKGKEVGVGNGTEVNLVAAVNKYEERGTKVEKARLALVAVQIVHLVPFSKQSSFGVVAGGFVSEEVSTMTQANITDIDDDLPY